MNKQSTRYFSSKQEKSVSKAVNGKQVSNSGATKFNKGDIITDLFLIEAKTKTEESKSFLLQKEWFDKNREEAYAMGKPYNALVFNFGDGDNLYIINERLFKYLHEKLLEEEEQ